jgi:drug/metabolite transporter (DMT)-like permease
MTSGERVARGQIGRGVALAALAAVLFGVTTPILERASAGVSPLLSGSLVYLGAMVGAGAMALLRRRDRGPAPTSRGVLARLAIVALVGAAVAPTLLVVGLGRTDAATASLLLALEAPFTVALARLFLHEHIGGRVLVAALLILAGAVVLVGTSLRSAAGASGMALIAAAALAWALDNMLSRPLADRDPLQVVALKGLLGGVVSGVCAALTVGPAPGLRALIALLALGAVGYGLSLQLFLRAQRAIGAARTASVFAVAPFVGVVAAFALGTPWPGPQLVLAIALVAAGVWLHASERHEHSHHHVMTQHDHMHRHDDGHHGHDHHPMPAGLHSHPHVHDPVTHSHEHSEDIHHVHPHARRRR